MRGTRVIHSPEQEAQVQRVNIHGAWIGYEITGRGPAVVFLAGRGAGFQTWRLQTADLQDEYGCLLFDLPGVGVSRDTGGPYTIDRFVRDTLGLLNALSITRAHFVGASLGAAIVQEIAIRHPDLVSSVTLMSTWSSSARAHAVRLWLEARAAALTSGHLDVYDRFSYLLVGASNLGSEDPRLRRIISPSAAREPVDLPAELGHYEAALAHDAYGRLPEIDCPTLVLLGSEDVITPPADNREVAERISGAQVVAIAGAGHLLRLEKPQETAAAIRRFLSALNGGATTIGAGA
jgi:pimeloyl-ACP methyl ester carboxylesterase